MILNNYKNTLKNQIISMIEGGYSQQYPVYDSTGKDISNKSFYDSNYGLLLRGFRLLNQVASTMTENTANALAVVFGNGTTPPTPDDFNMSGDILSKNTFGVSCVLEANKNDEGKFYQKCIYTITNNSGADITISEIGYVYKMCLMERSLLDTPVTIPHQGVGQVTYTIFYDFD